MKGIFRICALAAVLLSALSCQENITPDALDFSCPELNFGVNFASVPAPPASKTMFLSSEDGTQIPMTWVAEDTAAPLTKGSQTNTSGSDIATNSEFQQFSTAAWNSDGSAYIAAYETVTWANGKWSAANSRSWEKSDVKTFYAYDSVNLPSYASVSCTSAASQTLAVSAVPTTVSSQKDILMGYYNGNGNKTGTASIDFYHPMTAVVFKLGSGISDVQSISLSGVYAGGTVSLNKSDSGCKFSWNGTGSQTITQDLTADTDGDAFLGEPFILMPQNLADQNVTITLVGKEVKTKGPDGGAATFKFTLNGSSWLPGKTNTYTLGYIEKNKIVFTVSETDIQFLNNIDATETKTIKVTSANGKDGKTAASYTAEYSIDGENWYSYDATTTGVSGFSVSNSGSKDGVNINLTAAKRAEAQPVDNPWEDDEIEADNWDLSKCGIGGEYDSANAQNSANCYIVKHPGSYKFPCVYGNALKNGVTNTSGYVFTGTVPTAGNGATYSGGVLETFLNAKGNPIVNDAIINDVSASNPKAALLWCDAKVGGELLVQDVSLSDNYISFETASKENMIPGNAVIVLYDDVDGDGSYDTGEGLWSWHIWVTDDDLSAANTGAVSGGYNFMSRNLGWACNSISRYAVQSQYTRFKQFKIRLKQEGNPNYLIINVSQPDIDVYEEATCTYYQYGRKDPFTGILDSSTSKPIYGPDGTQLSLQADDSIFPYAETDYKKDESGNNYRHNVVSYAVTCLANSINSPDVYNTNMYVEGLYFNVWNMNATIDYTDGGFAQSVRDIAVAKTIYDPSPYGYKMPEGSSIEGYIDDWSASLTFYYNAVGTWDASTNSYRLKNASGEYDDALVFPALGCYTNDCVIDSYGTGFYHTAVSWHTYSGSDKRGTHGTQSMKYLVGEEGICIHGYTRSRACAVRPVLE